MFNPTFARLVTCCLILLSVIIFTIPSRLSARASAAGTELVVHEWGTFTSVAGKEGIALDWRPFNFESDLPSFVHSVDRGGRPRPHPTPSPTPRQIPDPTPNPTPNPALNQTPLPAATPRTAPQRPTPIELRYPTKSARRVSVRMETPILYFYAKEEMTVNVRVSFPSGTITEWYPQARTVSGGTIDWGEIKVSPDAHFDFPNDFLENHYYPARDTDAAPIQVGVEQQSEQEKFLFYRGVGNFDLPLSVQLQEDKVTLSNTHGENVCKVIIFENRGGKVGYLIRDMPQTRLVIERPPLNGIVEGVRREIKVMLIAQGLYEKEADAMLNTWGDSWFEEGLRVFYIMPRTATDPVLPLAIDPQPSELVRVLVGRTELITPQMEANVSRQVLKLKDPSNSVRQAALKEINKYGRFREFILSQVLRHTADPKVRAGVEQLLQQSS